MPAENLSADLRGIINAIAGKDVLTWLLFNEHRIALFC